MDGLRKFKVVVIPFVHVGHMNPLLPIMKELVDRGVEVVCFSEQPIQEYILKSGASFKRLYDGVLNDDVTDSVKYFDDWRNKNDQPHGPFPLRRIQEASLYIDSLIANVKAEGANAILHDTFAVEAVIVSQVLNIPLITHVSFSGLGILGDKLWMESEEVQTFDEIEAYKPWRSYFIDNYNVDIFEEHLPMQYYSTELIITTMIEELCLPLDPETDKITYPYFEKREAEAQVFVGPCVNESLRINGKPRAVTEIKEDPLPIRALEEAKSSGKRIVLVSFGTVITENLWELALWDVGGLGTGQAFFKKVVGDVVEALGNDENMIVILATGLKAVGLENDVPVPNNFIVRKRVPQLEILKIVDCFVSHMGANSMNESLLQGVPLVPFPGFADQETNGRLVTKAGAGYTECDLSKSGYDCTPEKIKRSIQKVLNDPSFATNAKNLGHKLRDAGGQQKAGDVIIQFLKAKSEDTVKMQEMPVNCNVQHKGFNHISKHLLTRAISSG